MTPSKASRQAVQVGAPLALAKRWTQKASRMIWSWVANAIFGIGSGDRAKIQVLKNPFDESRERFVSDGAVAAMSVRKRSEKCAEFRLDLGRARINLQARQRATSRTEEDTNCHAAGARRVAPRRKMAIASWLRSSESKS